MFLVVSTVAILAACGGGGGANNQNNTPIAPDVGISLGVNQVNVGDTITITWGATNADQCFAEGDWSGDRPINGSELFSPGAPGEYIFQLTCFSQNVSSSASATLSVSERPPPPPEPNRPPNARGLNLEVAEDSAAMFTLPSTDPDGDPLTYRITQSPENGQITAFDPATGQGTFAPFPDFNGETSLNYEVEDRHGATDTGQVLFIVLSVFDPPDYELVKDASAVYEGRVVNLEVQVTENDFTPPISFSWRQVAGPGGKFSGPSGNNHPPSDTSFGQQNQFVAPAVSADDIVTIEVSAQLRGDSPPDVFTTDIAVKAYHDVSGAILEDTVWESPDGRPLELNSLTTVAEGVTLTVMPGTVVRSVPPDAGRPILVVAGELKLMGTVTSPIFFQPQRQSPSNWGGISISGDASSISGEYVVIEGARGGLSLARANVHDIRHFLFRDNERGLEETPRSMAYGLERLTFLRNFKGVNRLNFLEPSDIRNCLFADNSEALDAPLGAQALLTVTGNVFSNNAIAMTATQADSDGVINAVGNFWEPGGIDDIAAMIIDRNDNALLKEISFLPTLDERPIPVGANLDLDISPTIADPERL